MSEICCPVGGMGGDRANCNYEISVETFRDGNIFAIFYGKILCNLRIFLQNKIINGPQECGTLAGIIHNLLLKIHCIVGATLCTVNSYVHEIHGVITNLENSCSNSYRHVRNLSTRISNSLNSYRP